MHIGTKTMGALLERNSLYLPEAEALIFENRRFTHRQLHERALGLADALHSLGLARQERVAVLATNRCEVFEIYFACYLAGYIAAPVNFRLAAPEIRYILNDAAPKVLCFEARYAALIDALRPHLPGIEHFICIDTDQSEPPVPWAKPYDALAASGNTNGPPLRSQPDDYAHLLYTSGTTGKPKGVVHTHKAVCAWASTIALITDLNGASRVLQTTPLFHIGGFCYPYGAWWMGGTTVLMQAFEPRAVLATIERERITYTFMVAAMIQAVLAVPEVRSFDLSSMKRIVSAAAPIPVPLLKEAISVLGPIFSVQYGATEFCNGCNLPVHMVRPDGSPDDIRRLASVGHVAPGIGLRIVDEQDRDCPTGTVGEVLFKTEGMMSAYWNNHPATIEAIRDGWYHTGDLGYLDQEGFVFLVDRKKDMIISGGENIYSREVEEALHQHPKVLESAVIGMADPKWGEAVKAFVVLRPNQETSQDELVKHCRTLIAGYKCPREIEFMAELPRIASGKINKVALRDLQKTRAGA
jgi:acyl-CoA synthetase (AMP-forming)/AMP-acid ligase II